MGNVIMTLPNGSTIEGEASDVAIVAQGTTKRTRAKKGTAKNPYAVASLRDGDEIDVTCERKDIEGKEPLYIFNAEGFKPAKRWESEVMQGNAEFDTKKETTMFAMKEHSDEKLRTPAEYTSVQVGEKGYKYTLKMFKAAKALLPSVE